MSRSRSYEKSRHSWEPNRRPVLSLSEAIASFEDSDVSVLDELARDPAFPVPGRRLYSYLTPRRDKDLHQRRYGGLSGWELERARAYETPDQPIFAFQEAA